MPGRSPAEAVEAFLEPVQDAIGCLGRGKITLSPKGRSDMGRTHLMSLNNTDGMVFGDGLRLRIQLHYEIIRSGPSKVQPFRVTTRAYLHSVEVDGHGELIAAHWHPTGASPYDSTHWHIGTAALAPDGVFTPRAHVTSPRVSVESMIRLCISQFACQPARSDWESLLAEGEANFVRYQSWGSP